MTAVLLLPLMIYAACGLVLSLAVHLLTFAGIQPGGDAMFFALHIGIFPLWLPVVLIMSRMTGTTRGWSWDGGWSSWNRVLAGCPTWMRYMTYGFFGYAALNFAIFIVMAPTGKHPGGGSPPSIVWHGFSGHWMAFYSAGLAVLTAAYRRGLGNLQTRCPNGHPVGVDDRFCPLCGTAIAAPQVPGKA